MNERNNTGLRTFILVNVVALSVGLDVSAAPAKKKATPTPTPAPRTVGDMLKASQGKHMEKGSTSLPTVSNQLFKDQPQAKPVDLSSIKPPRTHSFYQDANDDKAKLEAITDRQINELYKLTQRFRQSTQRGELWLRLAELYVEKAGIIDFRKQDEYDRALRDFQAGKTKVKPKLDLSDAREYNKRAIELYEWFVRDFPKDPKMDQALFFLGYNYYELGNTKKGTEYYARLTKDFPHSQYNIESSFALAEYYFELEKWNQAKPYYEVVTRNRRHRLYAFSMYKMAWCYFRSGDARHALGIMERLVRESKEEAMVAEAGQKRISKSRLEAEGLRDMVMFYSEVGDAQKAPAYFQSLSPKDANNYIEKLAYLYSDKGNREGAKFLFNFLIEQAPTAPKAFDYKYQIVHTYSTANRTREFREQLYSWIKDFGINSQWYQVNKNNKDLVESSNKLREQTLRTWVLQQHQTAQNSRTQFAQSLAFEGYRLYLSEFPDNALAADMHFYFGELLYDMGRFDDAGNQYRWVVEKAPTNKFASKAGENMVLALEKNVPKDDQIQEKVGKTTEPMAMDPKVERFCLAGLWYSQKFPKSEKTPEIRFRVGRLYYQYNQFDKAIPIFKDIVAKYPKTKYSEYAANLLLDIYNVRKDYAGLEKMGQELLKVPGLQNSQVLSDIKGVLEKASFKKAQDLEVKKDYGKSAEMYENFVRTNPRSELASAATFNAAINYERANMVSKAIAAHVAILKSNDKGADKYKPKSRRIIAKLYQDSGMLEEAAVAYEHTAAESGNDPLAPALYNNAAVLNEALGREQLAIRDYEAYLSKVKKASERAETHYSLATMHRKSGRYYKAVEHYKEFLNFGGTTPEKNVEAAYWIYDMDQKLRRKTESEEYKKKVLAMQRRYAPEKKGPGASYAAKIKILDARETYAEMRGISLNNLRKLKENSEKKTALITKLNNQLGEVIKYDSPEEIISSLYLLGQANLHMSEALTNSPVPPELKKTEEISQYKAEVQKLADPFVAKAKESLKAAVDRGSEFETYSGDYQKARDMLAQMDPKIIYNGGERGSEFTQTDWAGL